MGMRRSQGMAMVWIRASMLKRTSWSEPLRLAEQVAPAGWLQVSKTRATPGRARAAAVCTAHGMAGRGHRCWSLRPGALIGRETHGFAGRDGDDTVFALSTAPGRSGVAVIRISGPATSSTIAALTNSPAPPPPRVATVRNLQDPRTGQLLDVALVLYFQGPKSFTGEDSGELHVHGSPAVIEEVLACLTQQPSLRPALPGEFTRRALLNGKLGLLEAEGLADLIAADTSLQRQMALQQLSGTTTALYDRWRGELVKSLAHVEAFIDFGEDDEIDNVAVGGARERGARVLAEMSALELSDRCGEVLRSGVPVVLTGPPNAGKSSLLNVLARRQAAIVSPVAGTTRDVVEVRLNLEGTPVILRDTAGLRVAAESPIEVEGVIRALDAFHGAMVRVVVVDVSAAVAQVGEVLDLVSDTPTSAEQQEQREPGVGGLTRHLGPARESEAGLGAQSSSRGGVDGARTLILLNKVDTLDQGCAGTDVGAVCAVEDEVRRLVCARLGKEAATVCAVSCVTGQVAYSVT